MQIIAFSGKKQSGKTTAVEDLRLKLGELAGGKEFANVNFADALKMLLLEFFIAPTVPRKYIDFLDIYKFDEEEYKNTLHPCGKTYRELLKTIGTDWFRDIWPEIWIKNYELQIADESDEGAKIIVTSDVRFPNEVECVQKLGGHVIRLLRNPYNDQHESETALDFAERDTEEHYPLSVGHNTRFDAIIDNKTMSVGEQNETVWTLVQEKKWL